MDEHSRVKEFILYNDPMRTSMKQELSHIWWQCRSHVPFEFFASRGRGKKPTTKSVGYGSTKHGANLLRLFIGSDLAQKDVDASEVVRNEIGGPIPVWSPYAVDSRCIVPE